MKNTKRKILYFEGAGSSSADISKATVGNCRIRTAFHLDNGRAVYLEITGAAKPKITNKNKSLADIYKWQYTGFIDTCHYITDDKPNNDCNKHGIAGKNSVTFEYTEAEILKFVNSLGASFDAVKVVPDLGGYRVFPEKNSCSGLDGYYYGDKFNFDAELTEKRKQVYDHFYQLEKAEGKQYPNFSLWVDEFDKNVLHLLRHFSGTFETAHNKHWIIKIDKKDNVNNRSWTMTESVLGKYGC